MFEFGWPRTTDDAGLGFADSSDSAGRSGFGATGAFGEKKVRGGNPKPNPTRGSPS